ncbi:hypothetical protein HPO96_15505 [Kribbella sandramycini]|uniref:Uncharacterized protein n=1 Tax=Kribbella sandramycini TaxID=60450 RepID=A0A7Y4KZQ4_9ACTN|nr:hypothetical protein [Kribbella sandramycini]MBB6565384.1 hypothetical protein [Kribbella sandramycini]NOL41653.1 hypothetical protein [Kribbella sandramycini]
MSQLTRRSVLGIAAAAAVAPLAATLPARAATRYPLDNWGFIMQNYPVGLWNHGPLAQVGAENVGHRSCRSFFRMPIAGLAGQTISAAAFTIQLVSTVSSTPYPVYLFGLRDLDPAEPISWADSSDENTWRRHLDTLSATAHGTPPRPVLRFEADAVREQVQAAATARSPYISLGLRAPDEWNRYHGKSFAPATAALVVTTA